MKVFEIKDTRRLMSGVLAGSLFDDFLLLTAQITTFCTFRIDGKIQPDFFEEGSAENKRAGNEIKTDPGKTSADEYVSWKAVKKHCFEIVKGKQSPLSFKFVFTAPRALVSSFLKSSGLGTDPDTVSSLSLSIRFDRKNTYLTTGTAVKSFSADRSLEEAWDSYAGHLLRRAGIEAVSLT